MPSVFKKTILAMGKNSRGITLPPGWLRFYGLRPGDKVEIVANDDLVIRPLSQSEQPASIEGEEAGQ